MLMYCSAQYYCLLQTVLMKSLEETKTGESNAATPTDTPPSLTVAGLLRSM